MQSLLETPLMAGLAGLAVVSTFVDMFATAILQRFALTSETAPFLMKLFSLVTSGFVESNLVLCAVFCYIFIVFGRPLEREVGIVGLLLPMLWTAFGVGLLILLLIIVSDVFGVIGVFSTAGAAYGMWPVAEVILLMQCRTSEPISWTMPHVPAVKAMHLPLALVSSGLFADLISCTISDRRWACSTVAAFASFWLAWYYMRFVSIDSSPSFAFHMFFYPAPVRALMQKVGNALHRQATKAKLVRSGGAANASLLPTPAGMTASAPAPTLLPGSTEEDASRRRNIALAALAKRLQQVGDDTPAKEEEQPRAE